MFTSMDVQKDVDLPVDASDKDGQVRQADGDEKDAKVAAAPDGEAVAALGLGAPHPAGDADEVVEPEGAKGGEDDDLQGDAGDDGLVARLLELGLVVAGRGGDAAADGLDDEAGDVGGEEDARVPGGGDAGDGRVQGEGDVLEGEVDADADERRAEDDGADLQLKGALVPGVAVQEDAADVACDVFVLVAGFMDLSLFYTRGERKVVCVCGCMSYRLFLISGRR